MNSLWIADNVIVDLADQGGAVLWVLFFTCVLLWSLILERLWFLRVTWPRHAVALVNQWSARVDNSSWRAIKIREAMISEAKQQLHALLPLVQGLVALCPLLGLLGTVLGMIGVFEVVAISGNENAQALAQGVYRATIPTMAGLVVALTGIYFTVRLRRLADREASRVQAELTLGSAADRGQRL